MIDYPVPMSRFPNNWCSMIRDNAENDCETSKIIGFDQQKSHVTLHNCITLLYIVLDGFLFPTDLVDSASFFSGFGHLPELVQSNVIA